MLPPSAPSTRQSSAAVQRSEARVMPGSPRRRRRHRGRRADPGLGSGDHHSAWIPSDPRGGTLAITGQQLLHASEVHPVEWGVRTPSCERCALPLATFPKGPRRLTYCPGGAAWGTGPPSLRPETVFPTRGVAPLMAVDCPRPRGSTHGACVKPPPGRSSRSAAIVWGVLCRVPNGYCPHTSTGVGCPAWGSGLIPQEASATS
jgi:hypothetical protein